MKKYKVQIPIAGSITYDVEATSEEEAKSRAWDHYENNTQEPDKQWDAYEELMTGSVQNFDHNEIEVFECISR